ncbi:hypothetical protein LTR10_013032 [Elasticomyces elasticus]|uniref:Major facilitator superfamily (MFS) profile domain-containing protein n=1 Tax=Exophiala sideris TaxID=1016849 RepID=A0ABR0JB83_9EURO|nr:hypothetical protein LTR10_013032 [Elasticomyces elasticus]KAK5030408.1 hypothetical protein LTS07_005192 [Exophiala sideris]KAK5038461.1 hypothetical protein LTR13_004208 [Exophiala sideris]KAK5060344.1 hypothetical protein LTR69_005661 [Exophiala sideris]KAK5183254.1 hypothetical protein LTR44_004255 [Eurotiomycetes sp. CCFEE 6388]
MGQTDDNIALERPATEPIVDEGELKTLHQHGDKALDFLETHEAITYTKEEEKAVLRKIDKVLIPLMLGSYTIQYMDKSVMAQTTIYDLFTSLGLHGQQYSWCSAIFYFGYLAFQPILARLLNYVPLGRFVAYTSLAWAVLLFCTAGAFNYAGMMSIRFFLGVAEGGISPAFVLITGTWYKKNEIPFRITLWYCGNGLANILQSFISYGIGHIDNTGVATWRWFFIIFGILGLVWAVVLWLFFPDSPLTAKFLNDREKSIAIQRLKDNRTGVTNTEFKKEQLIEALTDVKVWYGFFYAIACVVPATSIANFGSLIIKGFGFGTFETSLLSCPLGVVQDMTLIAVGYIAYSYKDTRCLMQILCNIPAVIGSVLVYALPQSNRVGRLLGFYMTPTTNGSLPMLFALTTTNIAGHTKRSVATSVLFLGYCVGFIIGPQFFLTKEAPRYQTGFQEMIVLFALSSIMPAFYWLFAKYLNRKKASKLQEMQQQGADQHIENEEFFDLTDKQQQHFVYSM